MDLSLKKSDALLWTLHAPTVGISPYLKIALQCCLATIWSFNSKAISKLLFFLRKKKKAVEKKSNTLIFIFH